MINGQRLNKLIQAGYILTNLDTLTKLINETAQQIAKHARDKAGQEGYFEQAKELQAEIDTYAKIYTQIAIMKASKDLRNNDESD